jgi:hypothetical protein
MNKKQLNIGCHFSQTQLGSSRKSADIELLGLVWPFKQAHYIFHLHSED